MQLERVRVRGSRSYLRDGVLGCVIIFTCFDPEQSLQDTCWPLAAV